MPEIYISKVIVSQICNEWNLSVYAKHEAWCEVIENFGSFIRILIVTYSSPIVEKEIELEENWFLFEGLTFSYGILEKQGR